MNFFGHAALAASHFGSAAPLPSESTLATLCAGAMLPDFVGMLRLGRPELNDSVLARGVLFHHKTDEAFHDLPTFVRLSRQAFAWLSERGLPRGPARAIAHIGIEMLLDEVFAVDAAARDAYRAALRVPLGRLLSFPAPPDVERLAALQLALLQRAETALGASPEVVAERIRRTLAGRPRLATDDASQELLARWVGTTRPLVFAEGPEVFPALRLRLANFGGP
jgi:hypothetical protein